MRIATSEKLSIIKSHDMRNPPLSVLLILICAVSLAGCGKKAGDEIDFGTVKDSVYENRYLGFSVPIPNNWSVQDQQAQRQMMARGNAAVAGDDRNLKAVLKASELQTVNLFAVFKYPQGSAVNHNPAILAVAERVSQLPGIRRGKDYLFHARHLLESGQFRVSFPKDDYSVKLGGVDFDVMDMELSVAGKTVKEKYYATIRKGYALSFIEVYVDEDEDSFERAVLEKMIFK